MIKNSNTGFTLIELMIVVVIIAIIASVAIPSYRSYVVRNAESQVQARLFELSIELERHKSTRLSYRGFVPKKTAANGSESYEYDETDNTTIYVPNKTNYRYKITLADSSGNSLADITTSTAWKMTADRRTGDSMVGAHNYLVLSDGSRCKDRVNSLAAETTCTGKESW